MSAQISPTACECRTGRQPDPDKTVYDAFLFSKELNAEVELPFSTYVSALFAPLW